MPSDVWTITITPQTVWIALLGVMLLTLIALLLWSGLRRKNLIERLGREWRDLLYVVIGLFFVVALFATGAVLFDTIRNALGVGGKSTSPNLGAGALIAAILGAPFVIWGTVLKHQTLRYTKEGHITDRISKAVEQLGAEKKVDRIGRPVTLLSGEPKYRDTYSYWDEGPEFGPDEEHAKFLRDEVEDGGLITKHSIRYWPERRTVIEWRGEALEIEPHEKVFERGAWQAFSETAPNIEVRLGALLSLERISQDSVAYDKGRDHVRVMEILCAYIRNNAPASSAQKVPGKDPQLETKEPTNEQLAAFETAWDERSKELWKWATRLPAPREDVQLALSIIGRRDARQKQIEARWGNAAPDAEWVFDNLCPASQDEETRPFKEYAESFRKLDRWKEKLESYSGYRPDLRDTNLQSANLQNTDLSGAILDNAHLQGANLNGARLIGAKLLRANIHATSLWNGILQGANMEEAHLTGALLLKAHLQKTTLWKADLSSANLRHAKLQGADLLAVRFTTLDVSGAIMNGTSLGGQALGIVRGLTQKQLDATSFGISDTLPEHLTRPAHWDA